MTMHRLTRGRPFTLKAVIIMEIRKFKNIIRILPSGNSIPPIR